MKESGEGQWEMVVSASRDIGEGEQLLLSYGERSSDDFFLHYVGRWLHTLSIQCTLVKSLGTCLVGH